jgi:hypothetical protein
MCNAKLSRNTSEKRLDMWRLASYATTLCSMFNAEWLIIRIEGWHNSDNLFTNICKGLSFVWLYATYLVWDLSVSLKCLCGAFCLLLCLLGLIHGPEDRSSTLLWSFSELLLDYMASYLRRYYFTYFMIAVQNSDVCKPTKVAHKTGLILYA